MIIETCKHCIRETIESYLLVRIENQALVVTGFQITTYLLHHNFMRTKNVEHVPHKTIHSLCNVKLGMPREIEQHSIHRAVAKIAII